MKRKRKTVSHSHSPTRYHQQLFWALCCVSFLALFFYRVFAHFPVWFDEIVMKAVVFGLPLWIYALITKRSPDSFGFDPKRFWPGAFSGLAIGGLFGFLGMLVSAFKHGHILIPSLFQSMLFWQTFGLAFVTAWWESIFFYGLVLSTLVRFSNDEWDASLKTSVLFVLFHAPIFVLRSGIGGAIIPLVLLAIFAFGQSVIFLRTKSIASVIVGHAFWGMALLVYTL